MILMKVRNAGNQPAYNVFFGGADEARASPRGAYADAHPRACAQLTCEEKVTREEEELLGDAFPKSETITRQVCVCALGVNSTLELHCFEPSQVTFQKLSANPALAHAFLNNIGLGSIRERGVLYTFGESQ